MGRVVLKNLVVFTILVVIDQLSKSLAKGMPSYHLNYGIMFGMLKDSSLFLRLTSLASSFGFIFSIYLILTYSLNKKLWAMKLGMTSLVAGIFGNVIDKVVLGASVDFIPLSLGSLRFAFNIADIFQWVGAAIIIYKMFKKEDIIWYPDNKRGKLILYRREQLKFSAKLTLSVICASMIFGIFTYSFVQAILIENNIGPYRYMTHFTVSYISLTLIFATIVFISGFFLSHKTAGPIYSFINYIDSTLRGECEGDFTLRENDNYRDLEELARKIKHFIRK